MQIKRLDKKDTRKQLGNLKSGDIFKFEKYDKDQIFLILPQNTSYLERGSDFNKSTHVYLLNIEKNTIHHRTKDAIVQKLEGCLEVRCL